MLNHSIPNNRNISLTLMSKWEVKKIQSASDQRLRLAWCKLMCMLILYAV